MYADGLPPWEIKYAQPAFVERENLVEGSVLDSGCGTGENALFFADRGHEVVGVDFQPAPIEEAKAKAKERNLKVDFQQMSALELSQLDRQFETVLDCGLFHTFSNENRAKYVEQLASVTKPLGHLLVLCFSDQEPGEQGPRRVTEQELRDSFADGWTIEDIEQARFVVRPTNNMGFTEGGAHAWFATIRRTVG